MSTPWKNSLLSLACMLLAACSTPAQQVRSEPPDALFTLQPPTDRQALRAAPGAGDYLKSLLDDPANEDIRLVKVTPSVIGADHKSLALPLPDGSTVHFNQLRLNDRVAGMTGWVGDVPSKRRQRFTSPNEAVMDPFNWISLIREGDNVIGSIYVKGQAYRLEPVGNGQHVLIRVDESRLAPGGEPVKMLRRPAASVAAQSQFSVIRLLLVSSNQVRASNPSYKISYALSVQNANIYMANSGVKITYEIAGYLEPNYSDSAGQSTNTMLEHMISTTHTLGVAIQAERERLKADLAVLAVDHSTNDVCGTAYVWSDKNLGVSVIKCWPSLGHELGHNLGGEHNWDPGDYVGDPSYRFGYRSSFGNFRTQMSYDCSSGCPKIPYHSTPLRSYNGTPMGTVEHHDVARLFNERRETVAAFYPDPAPPQVRLTMYASNSRSCSIFLDPGANVQLSWYLECRDNDIDPVRVVVSGLRGENTARKLCFANTLYTVNSCYTGQYIGGDFTITDVHTGNGRPDTLAFTTRLKGPVTRITYD